jgi:hypothetical protein
LIFCTKPYRDVNKALYSEWPCLIEVLDFILLQECLLAVGPYKFSMKTLSLTKVYNKAIIRYIHVKEAGKVIAITYI